MIEFAQLFNNTADESAVDIHTEHDHLLSINNSENMRPSSVPIMARRQRAANRASPVKSHANNAMAPPSSNNFIAEDNGGLDEIKIIHNQMEDHRANVSAMDRRPGKHIASLRLYCIIYHNILPCHNYFV